MQYLTPMAVATPFACAQVKCSVCGVNPVKRMCTSCRDSYCEACFQALHGKGKRRTHFAPVVHTCCVCKYQHVRCTSSVSFPAVSEQKRGYLVSQNASCTPDSVR